MSSYPCPFCGAAANLDAGCPACGRGPDPAAAEVIRLTEQIVTLTGRAEHARLAFESAAAQVRDAQARRNALAAGVRARVRAARPGGGAAPTAAGTPSGGGPAPAATGTPAMAGVPAPRPAEASTRTVQTVLFVLGGLLLGTAAIVFTAVAWATFGVGGRAAILGSFTALALGVPPLLLRRGLAGTAETFAAVGLLLVVLDGYAAWYVDLFGVAGGSPQVYAGVVCAVTTVVAVGYGALTRLVGPRFAALVAAQPVLPLLVAEVAPGPAGWSATFAAVAALNAGVAVAARRAGTGWPAVRGCAWVLLSGALVTSGVCALGGLAVTGTPGGAARAGGALLAAALVLVAAAVAGRRAFAQAAAGAVAVVAVAVAAGRFLTLAWPGHTAVLLSAVAALLAGAVLAAGAFLPEPVRTGPWAAAVAVAGVLGAAAGLASLAVAGRTVAAALPAFVADLESTGDWDWQPPVALALLAAALIGLLPARARVDVAVLAGALLVVAAPAYAALPWWGPAALACAAAAPLAALAVRSRHGVSSALRAAAAAGLAGYALLAALGRPGSVAAVLGVSVLTGLGCAALGVRAPAPHGRVLGGGWLLIGLLSWPGAVAAGLAEARVEPWWVARCAVLAVGVLLVVLAVLTRAWPAYRWHAFAAVLAGALPVPFWALPGGTDEPSGLYAAAALLLLAAAPLAAGWPRRRDAAPALAGGVAVLPGAWWAIAVTPPAATVLLAPYAWLDAVWRGRPTGVGLAPYAYPEVAPTDAVAIGTVAAVAAVLLLVGRAGWPSGLAPLAAAVPVAFAASGAPWPAVPAASLLLGLALALAAVLRRTGGEPLGRTGGEPLGRTGGEPLGPAGAAGEAGSGTGGWRIAVPLAAALLLTGPGLAGSLPTRGTTLAALGLALVAAVVAGAAGRAVAGRVAGWLSAVTAGLLLALASALAAGLDRRLSSYAVLGAAALALALGALLRQRRGREGAVEAVAVEAAAQAGALTALLLALPGARHAAAVCTLWGVALGLRALLPAETPGRRRGLTVAAAGTELLAWWLLMIAAEVAVLEAYTLPAAAVGLLAGWLALRRRPALSSWYAYGPALAAALLPSLGSVLIVSGAPVRRLLLGLGALAVLLAGSAWRRQAPVVLGGLALAAVALHEVVLVSDRLPRWIPLAAAGLLLVVLAMTLEQRRRDLARVRRAVGRMT